MRSKVSSPLTSFASPTPNFSKLSGGQDERVGKDTRGEKFIEPTAREFFIDNDVDIFVTSFLQELPRCDREKLYRDISVQFL